uniref:C2H2-type domain-containing protein n=1 Tax=Anopheles christyi TaxID=43041 RepID=A0A182KGA6_9DIPT
MNYIRFCSLAELVECNPDTLICGNCRELFTDLTELLDHKRSYCKLRFTCKCLSTSPVQKV